MRPAALIFARLWPILDALLIAGVIAELWTQGVPRQAASLFLVLLVVPLWLFLLKFFGVYESQRVESIFGIVRKTLSAYIVGVGVVAAGVLVLPLYILELLVQIFTTGTVLLVAVKCAVYSVLHAIRLLGGDRRNVCVIGGWEKAVALTDGFRKNPVWGFRVVCVGVGVPSARNFLRYPTGEVLGHDLLGVLHTQVVDEVLIAVATEELPQEEPTIHLCEQYGVIARFLIEGRSTTEGPKLEEFCGEPSVALKGVHYDDVSIYTKRVFDFMVSAFLTLLLLPVFIAIAIVVKVSSPGPIVFRQVRVGLHGRRFTMYKFRTMIDNAEALLPSVNHRSMTGGPIFKDPHDLRVTRVGKVLRKFSLDEFPQLLNVLKGEMSLVGPRPLPLQEASAINGEYRRRFNMRPGITCFWQVNGRSSVTYDAWMQYDLQYVDKWSLSLDAKLLLKTIPVVVSGRGAC